MTLAAHGRVIRSGSIEVDLGEPMAADLVADASGDHQPGWVALPTTPDPLMDSVDLHGAHDFRHTFATWLEDAGDPSPGHR